MVLITSRVGCYIVFVLAATYNNPSLGTLMPSIFAQHVSWVYLVTIAYLQHLFIRVSTLHSLSASCLFANTCLGHHSERPPRNGDPNQRQATSSNAELLRCCDSEYRRQL